MSRNLFRQSRKDSRRARRWAGIVRKNALAYGCYVALGACFALSATPTLSHAESVSTVEKTALAAGMQSPHYTLVIWEGIDGRIIGSHLDADECFRAAGAVAAVGGDAECMPMGTIAAYGEE